MIRMLALYRGPGGPISVELDAEDLVTALALVEGNRRDWYDGQANALDVAAGATDAEVDEALEEIGWRLEPVGRSADHLWTLHEIERWPDEPAMVRALVLGPGPVSLVVDARKLGDVLVEIELHRSTWTAERRDALEVPHGAPESAVDEALAREGWRVEPIARSLDGRWTVHERQRFDDEAEAGSLVDAALAELEAGGELEAFTGPDGETRYRLKRRGED